MSSLRSVCAHPKEYWNLSITGDGKIEEASTLTRFLQKCTAFVSDSHRTSLRVKVAQFCERVSDGQEIFVEKISRYARSEESWLYQALPAKPQSSVALQNEAPLTSDIRLYKEGSRYYNHPNEAIWAQFLETLRLLFLGTFSSASKEDLKTWHRTQPNICNRSVALKITWIGHATLLIQAKGMNILVDPSFQFVGPCYTRHTAPGIALHDLPPIDLIINSHIHTDHRESVEKFAMEQPAVLCAKGAESWFAQNGFSRVKGVDWWDRVSATKDGKTITLTALPAKHAATIGAMDVNCYSWMGMMLEIDEFKIYFAGDTGFDQKHFEEIRKKFDWIDLACLPIAPEKEPDMHLGVKDALDAMQILEPRMMLPIHYGAYRTGSMRLEEELNLFLEETRKRALEEKIWVLRIGESFIPS
jgi:L-ascorbate metabolism protein UlaG (beta-lactamase superfamily)